MNRFFSFGIFRLSPLLLLAFLLAFALALPFLIGGICAQSELPVALGAVMLTTAAVGLLFFCFYGLTLTKKYLFLIAPDTLRIFSRRRVKRLKVELGEDALWGTVLFYDAPPYHFLFDEYDMSDTRTRLLKRFLKIRVKITPQRAKRIQATLSQWDKAEIRNTLREEKQ